MIADENISPFAAKRSWLLVTATIALVLSSLFSIFFEVRERNLKQQIEKIKTEKQILIKKDRGSGENKSSALEGALRVRNLIKSIEARQVLWSKIVEKIETTIPKKKDTNKKIIELKSYSGDGNGKIIMTAATRADALDPFLDTADLLAAFNAETSLRNVFIPSMTKSLTPEGNTILNFSMIFEYKKSSP